eukprot:6092622-Pyramimonas_sp.AAC.1
MRGREAEVARGHPPLTGGVAKRILGVAIVPGHGFIAAVQDLQVGIHVGYAAPWLEQSNRKEAAFALENWEGASANGPFLEQLLPKCRAARA